MLPASLALLGHACGDDPRLRGCFAVPAMYAAALTAVDRDLSGILSGVVNAARQAGGVIGVAVFGAMAGGATV